MFRILAKAWRNQNESDRLPELKGFYATRRKRPQGDAKKSPWLDLPGCERIVTGSILMFVEQKEW